MGYVNYDEIKIDENKRKHFNEKKYNIMGIDQSFSNTGICILEDENIIFADNYSSNNKDFLENRIIDITKFIMDNIFEYNVKHVNIEGLSFSSSQASGRQLAGLFYNIIINLKMNNITYSIIPPSSLKQFVTGKGNAKKDDMYNCTSLEIIEKLERYLKIKRNQKKFEDIIDCYHLSKFYFNDIIS